MALTLDQLDEQRAAAHPLRFGWRNMRNVVLAIGLAASLVVPFPVLGDELKTDPDSPEAVTEAAMKAFKEGRREDYVKYMHPDALKRLKSHLLSVAEAEPKEKNQKKILAYFEGDRSIDDLKKLDDAQFFTQFLEKLMHNAEFMQAMAKTEMKALGHVMEGKDTAHVVLRTTLSADNLKVSNLDVISLQKSDAGWRMLLTSEIERMTSGLKGK